MQWKRPQGVKRPSAARRWGWKKRPGGSMVVGLVIA
jgi:hypothetical protein